MLSIKYLPKWMKVSMVLAVIALPTVFMTLQVMKTQSVHCKVCITFKGLSQCREAQANDQRSCQQTATDNACAMMSSGMTETIQCGNTEPTELSFK